ncbi:MAG: hypothetical protein HRU14_06245 [Planctomycetes bacterium]|nr:hypothetical protein [Planctomycetota bacterium]
MPGSIEAAMAGSVGLVMVLYFTMLAFPMLYIILRWRSQGSGEPGIGTYAATHYFRGVALLVGVTAIAMLSYAAVSTEGQEDLARLAGGLLTGSVIFFVPHHLVAMQRHRGEGDPVGRVFTGFILLIAGTFSLVSIMVLLVLLFQEDHSDSPREDIRVAVSFAWVFSLTYLFLLGRMLRNRSA